MKEREDSSLCVCVSASPWSDWELWATLSGLSLHTRRCHISLTGQQASLLLRPSLTSMWIITQCWERQRKTRRRSRAFTKENPPSLNWACCGGGNKQYIFNVILLEHLMFKNERNRRTSQEYRHELKFFSKLKCYFLAGVERVSPCVLSPYTSCPYISAGMSAVK